MDAFATGAMPQLSGISSTLTTMNVTTLLNMLLDTIDLGDSIDNATIIEKLDFIPSIDDQQYFVETIIQFYVATVTDSYTKVSDSVYTPKNILSSFLMQVTKDEINDLLNEFKRLTNAEKTGITTFSDTCLGDLGCFPPERGCLSIVFGPLNFPFDEEKINASFIFWNAKDTSRDAKRIFYTSLKDGDTFDEFNPSAHTYIMTHGFTSSAFDAWEEPMRDYILSYDEDANVIGIDWTDGAAPGKINYQRARANTRVLGAMIARFVNILIESNGADVKKITLVGHSLGGQTSGYIGKNIQKLRNGDRLHMIVAMDPAGPCYGKGDEEYDSSDRIYYTDADYVINVHTDTIPGGLGLDIATGDYDFFVDGGGPQPGCGVEVQGTIIMPMSLTDGACSHGRSHELMRDQRPEECSYVGYQAKNYEDYQKAEFVGKCGVGDDAEDKKTCLPMDIFANPDAKFELLGTPEKDGQQLKYYLNTNKQSPFCNHMFKVEVEVRDGPSMTGTLTVELSTKDGSYTGNADIKGTFEKGQTISGILNAKHASDDDAMKAPKVFENVSNIKFKTESYNMDFNQQTPNVGVIKFKYLSSLDADVVDKYSGQVEYGKDVDVVTEAAEDDNKKDDE